MIVNNFLFRVRQWARDNRRSLIRIGAILLMALIVAALLFVAVARWKDRQYQKRVQTLEKQFADAEGRAKEHEARANLLGYEIDARKAELADLQAKADNAEALLKSARAKTITLKEAYETIRYVDVPADAPVSVADACRELAAVEHPCK